MTTDTDIDMKALRAALESLTKSMVTSSRDWARDRDLAWLYAVLVGWECEKNHDHNVICGRDAGLRQIAARYQWPNGDIDRVRHYRAAVRATQQFLQQQPPAPRIADHTYEGDGPGHSCQAEFYGQICHGRWEDHHLRECPSEYPGDDMHAGQLCDLPGGHPEDQDHTCQAEIEGTSYTRTLTWPHTAKEA